MPINSQPTAPPLPSFPQDWSLADLQKCLGVPPERIRAVPQPGTATEADVERIEATEGRLFELENGTLMEKTLGWYESVIASVISFYIRSFLMTNDLGQVLGADGMLRLMPGIVKIPDVSFISWSRFPKHKLPRRPVPLLVPDLAVEVLSEGNTQTEMDAKLVLFFNAGVKLVWYIEPDTLTAKIYTAIDALESIAADGELHGGNVLPGFRLSLATLFDRADRQGPQE